jgi:hypothetical protein
MTGRGELTELLRRGKFVLKEQKKDDTGVG